MPTTPTTTTALPEGYIPCERQGCNVPVAPWDDHYHCGNCASPRITGPYGHHGRYGWTCAWGDNPRTRPL